ncbi:MAG: thioredoxin domain-containing protein [Spirulinaceae cyanobacterium]
MTKLRSLIIALGIALFMVGAFFANQADMAAMQSNSSAAGLTGMEKLAQNSVPYQKALNDGKPTLLEFYADWCTTCQAMAPLISDFHHRYGEEIDFVTINIDDPQWRGLIKEYRVTGVPQFEFLDSQKEVTRTLVGRVPEMIFNEQLSVISGN